MKDFITINAAAKTLNIKKHILYKLKEKEENQAFFKQENGLTLVSMEFIESYRKSIETPIETQIETPIETDIETPIETEQKTNRNADRNAIENNGNAIETPPENKESVIEFLMRQIDELKAENRKKDEIIQENNIKISLLLEKQQELTEKALIVASQSQYLQASEKAAESQPEAEQIETPGAAETPPEAKKQGIFSRLFRR